MEESRRQREKELEEQRQRDLERRIIIMEQFGGYNQNPVNHDELTSLQKIVLGALIHGYVSEDMSQINNIESSEFKFTPSEEMSCEYLKLLTDEDIITPLPSSDLRAFLEDEDAYYIYRVNYHVNVPDNTRSEVVRNSYLGRLDNLDVNACFQLWKNIAVQEALEYLLKSMERLGFAFNPGKKTFEILNAMVEHYSVAQIYSIIYSSSAKGAKYFQETNISRKQAANTIISNCERYYTRAIKDGWKINNYYRDKECPQSVLSEYFFRCVLKIEDDGFFVKPNIELIKQQLQGDGRESNTVSEQKTYDEMLRERQDEVIKERQNELYKEMQEEAFEEE